MRAFPIGLYLFTLALLQGLDVECVSRRAKSSTYTNTHLKRIQAQVNRSVFREAAELKKTFGRPYCFGPLICSHITLDIKHVFGIKLKFPQEGVLLDGFHHDCNNHVKQKKIIGFSVERSNDYGAQRVALSYDNKQIGIKNFFPAEWPRKKVVRKIREAYNDFLKNGEVSDAESNGVFKIQGYTNDENMLINMHINEHGTIVTAYPAKI